MNDQIDQLLAGIRPMLAAQGKSVEVLKAEPGTIEIGLQGFCGGCGCSEAYVSGLTEMLTEKFPDATVSCRVLS